MSRVRTMMWSTCFHPLLMRAQGRFLEPTLGAASGNTLESGVSESRRRSATPSILSTRGHSGAMVAAHMHPDAVVGSGPSHIAVVPI